MATSTGRLSLPYIQQSQSQKEVTHNQALDMLDVLTQTVVIDVNVNTPPVSPTVGTVYTIGASPTGAWAGNAGYLAQAQTGGGWLFVAPFAMMQAWVNSQQAYYVYNGTSWVPEGLLMKTTGDYLRVSYLTQDVTVSGSSTSTSIQIPALSMVMAVNVHVITAVTGATTFSVGVSGTPGLYATGVAVALDSTSIGMSSSPLTYYTATPILLTSAGGSFTGGVVRTTVQYLQPHGPWTF